MATALRYVVALVSSCVFLMCLFVCVEKAFVDAMTNKRMFVVNFMVM